MSTAYVPWAELVVAVVIFPAGIRSRLEVDRKRRSSQFNKTETIKPIQLRSTGWEGSKSSNRNTLIATGVHKKNVEIIPFHYLLR